MCPKKEEQAHAIDDNECANKQKFKCDASNLTTGDYHKVDFRTNTSSRYKEEILSIKRIKLWLLLHILFSILFVLITSVVIYKLYTETLEMQNKILILNERIESLRNMYEHKFVNTLERNELYHRELFAKPVAGKMEKEQFADADEIKDGALAAHFKGSLPEIHIADQGLIGPWYPDNMVSRQYKFPKFHLTEGKCSIEVTEPALYFIYAQVYYITSNSVNSYSVNVRSEGSSENNIIAKCSAAAVGPNSHISEISCYTATVYSLNTNDRIFIQQTEKNRTIILRDGHSFFGLVRLNNSQRNK